MPTKKISSSFLLSSVIFFFFLFLLYGCKPKNPVPAPETAPVPTITAAAPAVSPTLPAPTPTPAPAVFPNYPAADLQGVTIVTHGLPGPLFSENDRPEGYKDVILDKFNAHLSFNALEGRAPDGIPAAVTASAAAGTQMADIILVSRADMAQMAKEGTIEDITDGILASGLPETYYQSGWLESRLYGFSPEPLSAGGLLIYNIDILNDIGAELPGDLFDRGQWSFIDFYNYCAALIDELPEGAGLLDVSVTDFLNNAVYANGGYVFHPETGQLLKDAPSFSQTVSLINRLTDLGVFTENSPGFSEGTAVFTHGSPEDAKAFFEMGINVGVTPYPWGPNIRINPEYTAIGDMLLGRYRTPASGANVFVLTRGAEGPTALAKAGVADYVNIMFSYLGNMSSLDSNAWRERTGLPPIRPGVRTDLSFLTVADRARLEWWRSKPAVFVPQERAETELREALDELLN
ncbi:MAG: extracellular solute-binding protein [Clostridiales bacterium]|nr:extracellular solute-binding protein [Clostridiales bacterium]